MRSIFYTLLTVTLLLSVLAEPMIIFQNRNAKVESLEARAKRLEKERIRGALSERQTTASEILRRRQARKVVELARRTRCTPIHYPTTSGRVYPTCTGSLGTGYAKYPGWDLARNDLAGNPVYPNDRSEAGCINACNHYPNTPDQTCIGGTWNGLASVCYLKNYRLCEGLWQLNDGHSTDLIGGCAAWAGLVPPEVDVTCCNN